MFVLSVVFGSASVGFMFKTKEAADNALRDLTVEPEYWKIVDDFGSTARIKHSSVHGFIVEDLDQSKIARAEQMVHQNRCTNLATKMATSDPSLRTMGSPAVITPHGMNGMR